ncbi:hypothetical protein GF327_03985 [Candidatus Woesearchaeota archaeon]|nr:hypothetical protein [Candidatus Woesearchaeota archaeon]
MKKRGCFLLIILFLLPAVFSDENIYNDFIQNHNNITLDNKLFFFLISNNGNDLLIKTGQNTLSVSKHECAYYENIEFCFNATSYINSIDDYKALMNINYLTPKIEIDREIDKNVLDVGEQAQFEVSVLNSGDVSADDVNYIDEFPEQVVIDDVNGVCNKLKNKVVWTGNLDKDERIECTYSIHTKEHLDSKLSASAFYYDGFSDEISYSKIIHLYSSPIMRYNFSLPKKKLQISEEMKIFINFSNIADDKIKINNLEISIPEELSVKSTSLEKKGTSYFWEGNLGKESDKSHEIIVTGKKTGVSVINANLDYEYNNMEFNNINFKTNIRVSDKGIKLNTSFKDNVRVDSNQNIYFLVKVKNLNEYSEIKNIDFSVETDIFKFENKSTATIEKNSTKVFYNMDFSAPEVNTTKQFPIQFNITYLTEHNEIFSIVFLRKIIVEPIKKIRIKKKLLKKVQEGTNFEVKVDLKNDRNNDVKDVYVSDSIPGSFQINGKKTNLVDIKKGETKTAYSYILTAPVVMNETTYTINTTAKYSISGKEYLFTDSKMFSVYPKSLNIEISKTLETNDVFQGEILPVKYVLENKEQDPAFGIMIMTSENKYIDVLNTYNYTVPKLNPEEKIILDFEQIRPKKAGNTVIDGSVCYFKDSKGRLFNVTSSSIKLDVDIGHFGAPALLIEKSANMYEIEKGATIIITLSLENIGNEKASGSIHDNNKKWDFKINGNSKKIINYNLSLINPGNVNLGRAYAYYNHLGNEYKASSNAIDVRVYKKDKNTEKNVVIQNKTESKDEIIYEKDTKPVQNVKKTGIITRFINWIKGLLKNN